MVLVSIKGGNVLTGQTVLFPEPGDLAFTQTIQASASSNPKISFQVVCDGLDEDVADGDDFPGVMLATSQASLSADPKQAAAILSYGGNILGDRVNRFNHWLELVIAQFKEAGTPGGGSTGPDMIIGINYYVHNQWVLGGQFIPQGDLRYRPFREIVKEVYERYRRPLFVAETGIEDEARPAWFRYVCDEVGAALREGAQVEGICLCPILNHPGWDDDRHCYNGLWDYADKGGEREIYEPLADELQRQRKNFRGLVGRERGNE